MHWVLLETEKTAQKKSLKTEKWKYISIKTDNRIKNHQNQKFTHLNFQTSHQSHTSMTHGAYGLNYIDFITVFVDIMRMNPAILLISV